MIIAYTYCNSMPHESHTCTFLVRCAVQYCTVLYCNVNKMHKGRFLSFTTSFVHHDIYDRVQQDIFFVQHLCFHVILTNTYLNLIFHHFTLLTFGSHHPSLFKLLSNAEFPNNARGSQSTAMYRGSSQRYNEQTESK